MAKERIRSLHYEKIKHLPPLPFPPHAGKTNVVMVSANGQTSIFVQNPLQSSATPSSLVYPFLHLSPCLPLTKNPYEFFLFCQTSVPD